MNSKNLSEDEIKEILYLSKQGNGRVRLICNLYRITKSELQLILSS